MAPNQWPEGVSAMEDVLARVLTMLEQSNVDLATVLATFAVLAVAFAAILVTKRLLRQAIRRIEYYLPYEMLLVVSRITVGALWVVTALLVLSLWGVSVDGLWTLLISVAAIIGVGFLAVWTMVSNITASLFIIIWRPYRLGQTIEVLPEGLKGRVIDRNLMFTVVRDEAGGVLQIPNNLFFQKIFRVSDSRQQSLFELYESDGSARQAGMPSGSASHVRGHTRDAVDR